MALGAFFVVAVALSACGSSIQSNAVVTVAGNPITLRAYDHWMFIAAKGQSQNAPGAPTIVPSDPPKFTSCIKQVRKQIPSLAKTPDAQIQSDCKQLFTSLNQTVLDFLIKTYWYELEANRLHIKLTAAQIQKAFVTAKNQQFKTQAQYATFLKQTGQTQNDILFRVRANKLFTILEARHPVQITPASIEAYYKAHLTQFGKPETRNIRIVRTSSQAPAAAAKAALAKGQSWSAVAKKYSVDSTTKNNGGLLTGVAQGQEETALNNAAFAAPQNKVLGPIHGTFGYYVFEVVKINKGSQQTLAQATPLIRELLNSQNQNAQQQAVDKVASKYWKAKTHCRGVYWMADCSGKAPVVHTTPVPTPAPPSGASGATGSSAPATSSSTPATTTPSGGSATPTVSVPTPTTPGGSASTPTATVTVPSSTSSKSSTHNKKKK